MREEHLVVAVNGLFGSASNWDVLKPRLQQAMPSGTLIHVSEPNQYARTFDGIDECGSRLADEITTVIAQHPSLRRISILGHSMGGVFARYAAGQLYDTESRLIGGLQPTHFMSLASPHLGCDPAQTDAMTTVPFIGWQAALPLVGSVLQRQYSAWAAPVASTMFGRTGRQLFYSDAPPGGEPPLMARLAAPSGPYRGALSSFRSRTAFANADGDHIVGWANASIRSPGELPDLSSSAPVAGVIRADPLGAALSSSESPPGPPRDSPPGDLSWAEYAHQHLSSLPWRRIDCSWKGGTLPMVPMGHNHIQVTRNWLNGRDGERTTRYIANAFAELESAISEQGRFSPVAS